MSDVNYELGPLLKCQFLIFGNQNQSLSGQLIKIYLAAIFLLLGLIPIDRHFLILKLLIVSVLKKALKV
jgi:hypothetical protein